MPKLLLVNQIKSHTVVIEY